MESFQVLKGCEKSDSGYHDYREEVRYNGEKWASPEARPEIVEHRAVCRKCEDVAAPEVPKIQRKMEWLELGRRNQALGMIPKNYK